MKTTIRRAAWNRDLALAHIRATFAQLAAWWDEADCFDRPNLAAPRIVQAGNAMDAAVQRRDLPGVEAACARWAAAVRGDG